MIDRLVAVLAACEAKAYDADKLATIVARLEAAPLGPAMALRILRDIA